MINGEDQWNILPSVCEVLSSVFLNHNQRCRPRQAISALNIPLSVMMAPLLACRLVSNLVYYVVLCSMLVLKSDS